MAHIEPYGFKTVLLTKMQHQLSITLDLRDKEMLDNYQLDSYAQKLINHFVVSLTRIVYTDRIDEKVFQYPIDWWQAVKERWFPKWAIKRWPIKYKQIVCTMDVLYPTVKARLPDIENYKHFVVIERVVK